MDAKPKISCLCITYNRPEFHDFLLWNFNKQTIADKELVVIDGSSENFSEKFSGLGIRYFHLKGDESIPHKRNVALEKATGEYITWFDDDDWQHPRKCEILCAMLDKGLEYAGSPNSLFYSIRTGLYTRYENSKRVLFNSLAVKTAFARSVKFDEKVKKASDSEWTRLITANNPKGRTFLFKDHPLFFWLTHYKNISNPEGLRCAQMPGKNEWFTFLLGEEITVFMSFVEQIRKAFPQKPVAEIRERQQVRTEMHRPVRIPAIIPRMDMQAVHRQREGMMVSQTAKGSEAQPSRRKESQVSTIPAPPREDIVITHSRKNSCLVGINVWNQFNEAKATYESLIRSMEGYGPKADLLVVDDCSGDPCIREFFFPLAQNGTISYIRNSVQKRLTRSWNILLYQGVKNGYAYVVQSNADIRFPNGWLDRFVSHLEKGANFLVPLTNQPGRFSAATKIHPQDIRKYVPDWKETGDPIATANETGQFLARWNRVEPIPSANGFFVGFRTDFLKKIELSNGLYWSEEERYLIANRGVGGDESEIRKRTGVQTLLAMDVYIHHMRPYDRLGACREEFLAQHSKESRIAV